MRTSRLFNLHVKQKARQEGVRTHRLYRRLLGTGYRRHRLVGVPMLILIQCCHLRQWADRRQNRNLEQEKKTAWFKGTCFFHHVDGWVNVPRLPEQ